MPKKSERNVMSGVKKGRPESFDALYEMYKVPIYNFIYQMTGDVEDAKDLTQDSFLAMYKVITDKKKVENLRAYLYTIARNKTLARLGKRSKEYLDEEFIARRPDDSYYSDPERAAHNRKQQDDIVSTLQMMPENYREVLVLREQAGFSYDNIALMMDTNKTNVGVMLYRARSRFREMYRMLQVTEAPLLPECERMLPMINAWLDGETTRDEDKELQGHLADCPFCRMASEQMVDANRSYHALIPLVTPLSVKAGLMAKAGLAGTISTSVTTGATAGVSAVGTSAVVGVHAATGAGAASSIVAASAGTGVVAGGAAAGIGAKAIATLVAAVIAIAAIGGGTFIGVKRALKPPSIEQLEQALVSEMHAFLEGNRDFVSIPEELRGKYEDMVVAAQCFIDEYLPELEVEDLAIVEESVDESIVSVSGWLDREGAADTVARQELLDCFLEVDREDMNYAVRSIQKED